MLSVTVKTQLKIDTCIAFQQSPAVRILYTRTLVVRSFVHVCLRSVLNVHPCVVSPII